ncbi:hypothetical protein CI102_12544 [Trichoderma harzianum]|uniref:Carbohydrate-binding module family 50 protein n=1 Tax=Trichoderma harzianum CBS 226.95 TaxID=983964 RepID=A0A2T4A0N6_TRIHA|nr:carbohydrate-binding module family 50 protein [Trichoderma harzianum CBS 226.95]PKK45567.1 hypothetical protein CI102_12544 [Trichoderma harzianum]PTB50626.1 carbohydrate-binding module family 50 protein [Trichoderma harzianum CBS 226.95]
MLLLSLFGFAIVAHGLNPNPSADGTAPLFNMTGTEDLLSAKCIQAMESPVPCLSDGITMLTQDDAMSGIATPALLTADDLDSLCTASCSSSLASLSKAIESACSGDALTFPSSNSTVYLPGTDTQENIFGGNGETIKPSLALDLVLLKYKVGCLKDSAVSGSDAWCYLRFQEGLTQECDDCELGSFRAQMEDPDHYDADLAVQYTSRVSSCHRSLTPIATPTRSVYVSSATGTTTQTCHGTMVPVATNANCDDFARAHNIGTEQLLSLNGLTSGCVGFPGSRSSLCVEGSCKTYTVAMNDTCSSIVKKAGIADVQFLSWNPMLGTLSCNRDIAAMVGHVVCIGNPLPYTPPGNTGSGPKTTSSSAPATTVGFDQLSSLSTIWTHEPLSTGTNTATAAMPWVTPTYALAEGSIAGCYIMYDNTLDGLDCSWVTEIFGVDMQTWVRWNPSVQRGDSCYLDAETRYCGLFWDPLLGSVYNNTEDSPYEPKPSDATAGATDECYTWDKTPTTSSDDLCTTFMTEWGITIDQFYAWNPAVGNNCQSLWLGTSYCVLGEDPTPTSSSTTSSTTRASTTTSGGAPAPTRPGTVQGCQKWYVAKPDDSCGDIATSNGITIAQFVAWNADVNPTTCDGFWPDYAYCVKAPTTSSSSKPPSTTSKPPSTTSKPPTSTSKPPSSTSKPPSSTSKLSTTAKASSTTTKVTAPGPTQSGIPAKCNKFAITQTGDGCESFATRNKITVTQLYSWNPVLENACKNFWAAEAYCIGVSA